MNASIGTEGIRTKIMKSQDISRVKDVIQTLRTLDYNSMDEDEQNHFDEALAELEEIIDMNQ